LADSSIGQAHDFRKTIFAIFCPSGDKGGLGRAHKSADVNGVFCVSIPAGFCFIPTNESAADFHPVPAMARRR
jgi:hypothetical protein